MIGKHKEIRSRLRVRAGFTLIEIMVSMVIMSVGLFAVAHMIIVSSRAASYAQERTVALNIAHAVAGELRARSMDWWRNAQGGVYDGYAPTFPDIIPDPEPLPGDGIAPNFIHSLQQFQGNRPLLAGFGNSIASGQTMPEALPINMFAESPLVTPGTILSEGAIFRVHYLAHQLDRKPSPYGREFLRNWDLIRVTVIVSWDNKDHGEQGYSWANWAAAFWQRHMVIVPVFIRPAYYHLG